MNAYIKLELDDETWKLKIFPPTDGGEELEIIEITNYLLMNELEFDLQEIQRIDLSSREMSILTVHRDSNEPIDEIMTVTINDDAMSAVGRFFPPSEGGKLMSLNSILIFLKAKGIKKGYNLTDLSAFLMKRKEFYCSDIIVARGNAVIQGENGYIEYCFNADIRVRPTLKEDGSADFFDLNIVNGCSKDQVLAICHLPVLGQSGFNILGVENKAAEIKSEKFKHGKNISISEDQLKMIAQVNGHVYILGDMVCVSNVYEVENVGNSTGNINYDGSVLVRGNVKSNFKIVAKGNVEVFGVVEGAQIQAEGNIIIHNGINGMNKGILQAGGNIVAKFIENSRVVAGGFIETGAILYSNVISGTDIRVQGKKGFITGGNVRAMFSVQAKNVGSPMGASTVIEIGAGREKKEIMLALQLSLKEKEKELEDVYSVIFSTKAKIDKGIKITPRQSAIFSNLLKIVNEKKVEVESDRQILIEMKKDFEIFPGAIIKVKGVTYAGTKIIIAEAEIDLLDNEHFMKYKRELGSIRKISI